jgi:hypothetical protein
MVAHLLDQTQVVTGAVVEVRLSRCNGAQPLSRLNPTAVASIRLLVSVDGSSAMVTLEVVPKRPPRIR